VKLRMDFVGLLGARGAKLAVGLATMFVYARMFGISATYDAWIWSLGIINAANLVLFGPVTETIRASYASIDHREGPDAADDYLATVAAMMIGSSVIAAVLAAIAFPWIAGWVLDVGTEQASASTFFLYVLAPSLALSQLVTVLTAHLNCHGRIYSPEIAGIIGSSAGVLLIVLFPHLPATWLLPLSYYMGLVTPLLIGAAFWRRLVHALAHLRAVEFRRHGRDALAFSLPLLLPYALGQVSGLVERQFALTAGTGVLAVLSYALFARNTVQAVFTAALAALAVPELARNWNPENTVAFRITLRRWAHQCLLLVTLGMIGLFALSGFIPSILFGTQIDADAQALLTQLLQLYAIAMFAVILYLLGGSGMLAAKRGKTYALASAGASVGSAALLAALFPLMGIRAVPIALTISHVAAAWLMFNAIDRADAGWIVRQAMLRVLVVGIVGTALRMLDATAHAAATPVAARLLLCVGSTGVLCVLWWLMDRRDPAPIMAVRQEAS
jgi:peptidoglycan biosynthesis protein MviN/MurJ (putative lipid II flippase)